MYVKVIETGEVRMANVLEWTALRTDDVSFSYFNEDGRERPTIDPLGLF